MDILWDDVNFLGLCFSTSPAAIQHTEMKFDNRWEQSVSHNVHLSLYRHISCSKFQFWVL